MKGVNKRVIEIVETNNEAIERVIIFLKPNVGNVRISHQKTEAEKYVSGLVCFKRTPWFSSTRVLKLSILAFVLLSAMGVALTVF